MNQLKIKQQKIKNIFRDSNQNKNKNAKRAQQTSKDRNKNNRSN